MAVTLTRPPRVDSAPSPSTGTILDVAWFNGLFDSIDAALALVLPLTGGTISGTLTVSGAGTFSSTLAVVGTLTATKGLKANTGGADAVGSFQRGLDLATWSALGYISSEVSVGGFAASQWTSVGLYASGTRFLSGTSTVVTLPTYTGTTFVAGDKYLVIDASGNVHRSAIGPAS